MGQLRAELSGAAREFPAQSGVRKFDQCDPEHPGRRLARHPLHQGIATYYDFANGDGNCMFGPSPNDLLVAVSDMVGQTTVCVTVRLPVQPAWSVARTV